MIDDNLAFEKTFTEDEKETQEAFEASMRDQTEVGEAARDAFNRNCDENFARSNTTCDGRLDREQFGKFIELSLQH